MGAALAMDYTMPGFFGIEAFNGSTSPAHNLAALKAAQARGLPLLGAGDAHLEHKVGCFATRIEGEPANLSELIEAIRQGKASPVIYEHNEYIDIFASDYFQNAMRMQNPLDEA